MKIDNSISPVGGSPGPSRNGATKTTAGAAKSPSGADVALSPLSARLQEISAGLANTPVVDAGRVAEIKQMIADGSYKIDAGKIADGLIDSVREMLASRR